MLKKNLCLVLLLIFLSGCANMSDADRTKAQGTGIGALGGGAIAALVAKLAGKDTESTLKSAAIGVGIGAVTGYLYGNHVATKKAKYKRDEDYLNACIASARQIDAETRNYNASLRQKIKTLDREIETLVARYRKRQASRSQLIKEQKKVGSMLASANKKLKRARDEVKIQKQVLAQSNSSSSSAKSESAKLDKEIKRLEKTVRELEGQTTSLAGINQKLSV